MSKEASRAPEDTYLPSLQHLGKCGTKQSYRFGTHEEVKLAPLHSKLDPNALVIASDSKSLEKRLDLQHEQLMSITRASIVDLRDTIDMDSWRETAFFPIKNMQAGPDTSFEENEKPANAPGYQWYGQIEAACRQLRAALVPWRDFNEEIDYRPRYPLDEEKLRN